MGDLFPFVHKGNFAPMRVVVDVVAFDAKAINLIEAELLGGRPLSGFGLEGIDQLSEIFVIWVVGVIRAGAMAAFTTHVQQLEV